MWHRWVSRSSVAPTSRSLPSTSVHCSNGRFVVTITLVRPRRAAPGPAARAVRGAGGGEVHPRPWPAAGAGEPAGGAVAVRGAAGVRPAVPAGDRVRVRGRGTRRRGADGRGLAEGGGTMGAGTRPEGDMPYSNPGRARDYQRE